MDVKCPGCGTEYEIDDAEIGRKAECEVCGRKFILGGNGSQQPSADPADSSHGRQPASQHKIVVSGKVLHLLNACWKWLQNKTVANKESPQHNCANVPIIRYKENRKYFSGVNRVVNAFKLCAWTTFGSIFLVALLMSNVQCPEEVWAISPILGCATGILYYIRTKANITDAEIDAQARSMGIGFPKYALDKLGIDPEEVSMVKPIHFWGYRFVWPSFLRDAANNNAMWQTGRDGVVRSSEVMNTIFYFGEHSVYRYIRTTSLVSDKTSDQSEEYYYRDIVSVKTDTVDAPYYDGKQQQCAIKTFLFSLANTGGEKCESAVVNPQVADAAVKAFRTLLRQKKF